MGAAGAGRISDEDLALQGERFGEGNIPRASEGSLFQDILFGYDSAVVPPEYHDVLRENARVLEQDPSLRVEIEGHCDQRGTSEYNLALGEERAKAVAAMLVSFGVDPKRLSTISYGEEIPVDPGNSEEAFARNRRAHFALYRPKPQQPR